MLVLCGSLCLCREPGEIRPDHSTEISGSPGCRFAELALSPRGGTPEDHGRLYWSELGSSAGLGGPGVSLRPAVRLLPRGVSPRNAAIDVLVTAHLDEDAPPLDHDGAAIWYVDVVRASRRFLLLRWLSSVDDASTRLCGKARAPLRQLTPLPRADQVLLSRCRTDSLPDLGTYRLRL